LDVALSQLLGGAVWEEEDNDNDSRDDEHNEDIVMWLMFETLCEGMHRHREKHRGHCCHLPPWPEDEACPTGLSSLPALLSTLSSLLVLVVIIIVVVVVIVCRRLTKGQDKDDGNDAMGDALVTTTTSTTYNDKKMRTITEHRKIKITLYA
jgi:hypothetical protein